MLVDKCSKLVGLFDALFEETKIAVIEDTKETYIVSDDGDKIVYIVKRSGKAKAPPWPGPSSNIQPMNTGFGNFGGPTVHIKKNYTEAEKQEIRRNNKLITASKAEVTRYIWEFNDNAAFWKQPDKYRISSALVHWELE